MQEPKQFLHGSACRKDVRFQVNLLACCLFHVALDGTTAPDLRWQVKLFTSGSWPQDTQARTLG